MHSAVVLWGIQGLAACGGDDGGSVAGGTMATEGSSSSGGTADDTGTGTEGEPVLEQIVPLDLATLELDAQCFELEGLPEQLSVAPEGHLWLRQDDQTWRVIDPFGNDTMQVLPASVGALQAWSEDRAFVFDQGGLWDVQGEWPQPLAWPEGLPEPVQMCGDPSANANGFVVAEGLLHRDGGQWWEWTNPDDQSWSDVAWLARNAGTCIGSDGELWLSEAGGEVWRITGDFAARAEPLDDAIGAVLVDGLGAAVLHEGQLVAGDLGGFVRYSFEVGSASVLSSGGEVLWVVAGGTLHRLLDGEFMVAMLEGAPIEAEHLHAEAGGGVWTVTAEQACHLRPNPPVRVEGVHNLQRLVTETVDLAVQTLPGTALGSATLDGEALAFEPDGANRWSADPQTVVEGWHTLELEAEGDSGSHVRRLHFEQRRVGDLTWSGDVEPLFEEHCSGAACHGPGLDDATRPDLSTWEAWTEREATIIDRVVTKGDMPPSAARNDTWGLDLQLLVSEWFETGAAQGDG